MGVFGDRRGDGKTNVIHIAARYDHAAMIATLESPPINTLGDLLDRLGGIPADRVRFRPAPGEATAESSPITLDESQSVDGGAVLPGFSFSIHQLFAEAQQPQA